MVETSEHPVFGDNEAFDFSSLIRSLVSDIRIQVLNKSVFLIKVANSAG